MGTKTASRRLAQKKSGVVPDLTDMISAAYRGRQATIKKSKKQMVHIDIYYMDLQVGWLVD